VNIITTRIANNGDFMVELNGREIADVLAITPSEDEHGQLATITIRCAQYNQVRESDATLSAEENAYRVKILRALDQGADVVWCDAFNGDGAWRPLKAGDQPAWELYKYKVLS
jgi:hypothetical protein